MVLTTNPTTPNEAKPHWVIRIPPTVGAKMLTNEYPALPRPNIVPEDK